MPSTKVAKRRYDVSERGLARYRRYNMSEKGRATQRRYVHSEKARERAARVWAKYDHSPLGRARRKRANAAYYQRRKMLCATQKNS